jgi:hypothetical protein
MSDRQMLLLTRRQVDILTDRLETAVEDGTIPVSYRVYQAILETLFPEEFLESTQEAPPSQNLPGMPQKIREMAKRVKAQQPVYNPNDADAVRDDRLATYPVGKRVHVRKFVQIRQQNGGSWSPDSN